MNFSKFTKDYIKLLETDDYHYSKFNADEIKDIIKQYKYIDVLQYYYDSEKDENMNTWVDVEGMGYGWLWCNNWFTRHFKFFQRKQIRKLAYMSINEYKLGSQYLDLIANDIRHIVTYCNEDKMALEIRLSNERMRFL